MTIAVRVGRFRRQSPPDRAQAFSGGGNDHCDVNDRQSCHRVGGAEQQSRRDCGAALATPGQA
jgi:hypothetical protein